MRSNENHTKAPASGIESVIQMRGGGVVGGTDENRIRLHRPGSHRLPEMGNRFKAGTVLTGLVFFFFSLSHKHFPFLFSSACLTH